MDKDKKYVRIPGKLFVQQPDKVNCGVAIVHSQRAPQSNYAGLFFCFCRDLGRHRALEGSNTLPALPLLSQADCLLRGNPGTRSSSAFRLLS